MSRKDVQTGLMYSHTSPEYVPKIHQFAMQRSLMPNIVFLCLTPLDEAVQFTYVPCEETLLFVCLESGSFAHFIQCL